MLGLVLEGGAMRAGFVAGALMALMDKNLGDFDNAVAVSASVPTLAYFASGQRTEMEKVWRDELTSPKLVLLPEYSPRHPLPYRKKDRF